MFAAVGVGMELDWAALMRDAGYDPEAVRNVWELAREYAPGDEGLRRRIEAQGRAAVKRAKLEERQAGEKKAAASVSSEAADGAESAVAGGSANSGGYDPAEEERDFVRDVTRSVANRVGAELTREQALAALAVWREQALVEGQPWHYVRSPGLAAVTLGRWLAARFSGQTKPVRLAEDSVVWELATSNNTMRYLGWVLPDRVPEPGQTIVEYDVTAQFLAAMRSVRLGDGEPVDLAGEVLGAWEQIDLVKRPGWMVLAAAPDLSGLPAHARAAFAAAGEGTNLPTPLAAYLVRDHGVVLEVSRAVVWDRRPGKGGREVNAFGPRLARIAEEIGNTRDRLLALVDENPRHPAQHTLALLKDIYARFAAGFLRSVEFNDSEWLHPDWADQLAATAGGNALRALDKAAAGGWEPIGQAADSVWFLLEVEPATVPGLKPVGLELSRQPGKWHLNRWGTVTPQLVEAFRRGYPARVGAALEAIDSSRRESGQ